MARRLGLFVTGSSDYHGAGKVNLLGENTTAPYVLRADRGAGVRRPRRLAVSGASIRPTAPAVRPSGERGGVQAPSRSALDGPRRPGRRAVDRCAALSVTTASVLP